MTNTLKTSYTALTEQTAITLAKRLRLFSENSLLQCTEIGDGNLNLVFHITEVDSNKGIIIKQALPYVKVVGESWPLSIKRATIEANALKIFGSYCPEYTPKVFYSDEQLAITVMEDLSHLTIARTGLINGESYPLLSQHLGEYLAKTLFYTSDFYLSSEKKKQLAAQFVNTDLCKITEDLVFTEPFFDVETNVFEEELKETAEEIWADNVLKLEVATLKKKFLIEQEALIHGDLHTGSIFAGEEETKVIDPEFAFFGPIGFDIGQVFANLLFQAATRSEENRDIIFTHVTTVWDTFSQVFSSLWKEKSKEVYTEVPGYLEITLQKILADSFGFAGCELIRRTIGGYHVADLDGIEDKEARIKAKQTTLFVARELIKNRKTLNNTHFLHSEYNKYLTSSINS